MRLIDGVLLGTADVVALGPILLETVRRNALGSMRAGLAVQLGALGGRLQLALLVLHGRRIGYRRINGTTVAHGNHLTAGHGTVCYFMRLRRRSRA